MALLALGEFYMPDCQLALKAAVHQQQQPLPVMRCFGLQGDDVAIHLVHAIAVVGTG